MYDTVLVPTDGSEASLAAAREAFGLAATLGATVHVVYVVDESASTFLFSDKRMADVLERLTQEGETALDRVRALADEDVEVVTDVVRGVAVDQAIREYAEANGVDLVVMGTHGRRGLDHLLGSTTERVLAGTSIPVLVVNGRDD